MGPLRFCMVTTFYPPHHFGGDGVFVYRLAEALASAGHSVDVVHSVDAYHLQHPAPPEIPFTHHPGVARFGLGSRRGRGLRALAAQQLGRPAAYLRTLRRILEEREHDVVHFHNVSLMGGPGVLRLGRGIKLYTAHEYWLVCPTHVLFAFDREACTERRCLACTLHYRRPPQAWRYTGLLRRCLEEIHCLLMPSAFALGQHRAVGIDRPMVTLPHFVPPAEGEASDPGPLPPRPFFLYAGRLEKLKGVQDLLELFAEYREADLLVAGDGSLGPILRERARELPHVTFLGRVHPARLGALYHRAVAVVAPSLCYETFGLTAAEALMHGTPVVVRRIGALAEIVEESGGGYAFSSLNECRDALECLRTQPDLRRRMGEEGRRVAQMRWSVASHLDRYLNLVSSLRGPSGGRP